MCFDFSDDEWAIIVLLLPPTRQGNPRCDDRRFFNAIVDVLRTSILWDDVPRRYVPPTTVDNRFGRWAQEGFRQGISDDLQTRYPSPLETIDSTMVPAHRAAAGAEKEDCKAPRGTRRRRSASRAAG